MEQPPPPPAEQAQAIKKCFNAADTNMKNGDKWNLIPFKWWRMFQGWVKYDDDEEAGSWQQPSAIDNSELLENGELKQGLLEGQDFSLVPASAWSLLTSW